MSIIPINVIHEIGHEWICLSYGYRSEIWFDLSGGHQVCTGIPNNFHLYTMAGGVFGLAGSLVMATAWFYYPNYNVFLIVGLSQALDHFAKIVLEGFFYETYISGATIEYLTVLQIGAFFGMLFLFGRAPRIVKTV